VGIGNNAELEAPGEKAATVSGEIDEVARGREHLLAAPRHLDADIGESCLAGPALDQFHIELPFQVANLHGKRRLANGTGFRCPAEMTVARNCVEIAKLPKGDHAIISKSYRSSQSIRLDLIASLGHGTDYPAITERGRTPDPPLAERRH